MPAPSIARAVLAGATRVALGLLWLNEGVTKYRAGFGAADVLLVVDGARTNTRVPELFAAATRETLGARPDLFGHLIPLLEVLLGIALVLGVLTLSVAVGSVLTLMTYWLADLLIGQYPLMVVLALVIVLWPIASRRYSVTTVVERSSEHGRLGKVMAGPLRRWL